MAEIKTLNGYDLADTNARKDLEKKITAPENPVVGKILAVKEVLEDGKLIVEWIDVTDYVKNTDYATTSAAGVVRLATGYGVGITSNGTIYSITRTLKQYENDMDGLFIGKKTLENIKANYVKEGMTDGLAPAWTEEEQTRARERQGIFTITQEEYDLLEDTTGIYFILEDSE